MAEKEEKMKPIRLNEEGDTICRPDGKAFCEEWSVHVFFGIHRLCGGAVHVVRISEEMLSVNCADCGRLIAVPSNVNTMGRLRAHVKSVKSSRRRRR
ncbi:hypothetical protein HZB93_02735 [Candidatus Falkowbacteria bacterium]|nr:hypothetical protein [Candidatus Falkowbacteria bacterium]